MELSRKLVAAALIALLGLTATACQASVDENGAGVQVEGGEGEGGGGEGADGY